MKAKRFLSLILVLVLLCGCFVTASATTQWGDVDGNGKVEPGDARLALRYSLNIEAPTTAQRAASDVDGNNQITPADARGILRISLGLDTPFSVLLYGRSHSYDHKTFKEIHSSFTPMESFLNMVKNWCCYYTLHDVYRTVLQDLGYSNEVIEHVVPHNYPKAQLSKALKSAVNVSVPSFLMIPGVDWYVPSLAMNYYLEHPEYVKTWVFWDYYDDIVTEKVVKRTSDAGAYKPQVGDLVFMSNKTRTYVNGVPTVDHTAQIIEVYADGTFLCTEGSIVLNTDPEGDGKARVRERVYKYDAAKKTYVFIYNDVVNVLSIVRPLVKY